MPLKGKFTVKGQLTAQLQVVTEENFALRRRAEAAESLAEAAGSCVAAEQSRAGWWKCAAALLLCALLAALILLGCLVFAVRQNPTLWTPVKPHHHSAGTTLQGTAWLQEVAARAGHSSAFVSQALQVQVHRLQQQVVSGFSGLTAASNALQAGLSTGQLHQLAQLSTRAQASAAAWAAEAADILQPLSLPTAPSAQPAADTALWVQGAMRAAGQAWMHGSNVVQAPLASMAATLSASAQRVITSAAAAQHVSSAQAEQLSSVVEAKTLELLLEASSILQPQPARTADITDDTQLQAEQVPEPIPAGSLPVPAPTVVDNTSAVPPMALLQQCGTTQLPTATATACPDAATAACEACEACVLVHVLKAETAKAVGSIRSWAASKQQEGSQAYRAAKAWASNKDNWQQVGPAVATSIAGIPSAVKVQATRINATARTTVLPQLRQALNRATTSGLQVLRARQAWGVPAAAAVV